jgi:squalene cyclase
MGQTDALKSGGPGIDRLALVKALRQGRKRLWQSQRADGSWAAACDLGPASTAYVVSALAFIGRLDATAAAAASQWLRAQQSPVDGSVRGRPFDETGDVGATAAVWAALWLADPRGNADAIARARAFVESKGGKDEIIRLWFTGDPAALFLALAGLLPPAAVSTITPPLLANIIPGAAWLTRKASVILPWRGLVFGVTLRGLGRHSHPSLLVERERDLCLASLDRTNNQDGSWLYGDTLQASLALCALHVMGRGKDPRSEKALQWMEQQKETSRDGISYKIFQSDVWTTAFDLRALLAGGAPPSRLGLLRATRWLIDCQHNGSWAFQKQNTSMPDCDDVGVVLASLADAKARGAASQGWRGLDDRLNHATSEAIAFLRRMQNPDGGWPSFQHGLAGKPPGAIMTRALSLRSPLAKLRMLFDPPVDFGDPATEDVTGRVLFGLGRSGLRIGDPAIEQALRFLRDQQCMNGSWWGRWVVNYLAATAWVLRGVAAVGVAPREPWVRRAIDFIRDHQREDGGWGESVNTYTDPLSAGEGKASTPGLTGLVLSALVESGESSSPQAARAAAYLQETQRPDGSWPNGDLLHVLIPPTLYYVLPGAELQLPLEGLGRFADANRTDHAGESSPGETGETGERHRSIADFRVRLETARFESDDKADAAVVAIQRSGLPHVAPLIATITRNRDLIPSGLPAPAAAMFEDTQLPSWADPVKLTRAQQLFERCGWGAAMALFASSLPQCYACAEGAKILIHTEELRRNPQRRILETAQFVFDVTAQNAFAPQSRGLRSAQKVRLLHALVRSLVRDKVDVWNPRFGAPISQFFLVGTLMTFSTVVIDSLRTMELTVDESEADAWIHLWNVVGFFMGIKEDLLPNNAREAENLLEAVREMSWAPSEAGQLLAKATLGVLQANLLPVHALDGVAPMLVRHLAGDRCADLLGLPQAGWANALFTPFTLAMDAFDVEGASPLAVFLRRASIEVMKGMQALYMGSDRPEYETMESARLLALWKESVKTK